MLVQSCKFQFASSYSSNFTDQSALLSFQSGIRFDPTNSVLGGNWTEATSFCNWVGVSCSRNRQRVTSLNLSYMGLQGTISTLIGNLSFLVSLDLRNNSFYGNLPNEISRLHRLKELLLQFNQLEGNIPPTIHHCRELQLLSLEANRLSGGIPDELGFLPSLHELNLRMNNLDGAIPSSLGNISTLQILNLRSTGLTGSLPSSLFNLSSVIGIDLIKNNISGTLPMDICHYWPNIQSLNLSFNKFSGQLPSEIHRCKGLVALFMGYNMFDGGIPTDIGSLHKLELLDLGGNNLIGTIPSTVGNLSRLRKFYIEDNYIQGNIPTDIGLLSNLNELNMELNNLTGLVPDVIFNMSSLRIIDLGRNTFSGYLPSGSNYRLHNLERLYLPGNQLEGNLPSYFSNSSKLIQLDFGFNLLTGPIPATSLGKLSNLRYLALQGNQLTGEPGNPELNFLTDLSNCRSLETLVLHSNPLKGYIPDSIGNFSSSFQIFFAPDCQIKGHIPRSIGSLKGLTFIELSSNNLTGAIPSTVGGLERLQRFHVDDNKIEGLIPKELCSLQQLGEISFRNNEITGPIPYCISNLSLLQKLDLSANRLNSSIPVTLWDLENLLFLNLSSNFLSASLPASIGLVVIIVFAVTYMLRKNQERALQAPTSVDNLLPVAQHRMITYQELRRATDNFSESNFLGKGSFGSVYKGILSDGTIVAVKVLNLELEDAFKSFDAECKVLRAMRHRNLVKIISTCSNLELRALILQYMPNGNLEKWLYLQNNNLDIHRRVSIMVDVASALEYLHHGQSEPVVHCDLKPSNILLDEDMVAHVSDFGISKILAENKNATHTKTLGTLGYIAPEYGSEGKVSTRGDVYSYGIMLLEIFTAKKPTDEMFSKEMSLRKWVAESFPKKTIHIIDGALFDAEEGDDLKATHAILLSIIELGLECTKELPVERIDMKDVVVKLNKIKLAFLPNRNNHAGNF
ncbi:hypothetical protein LWI29_002213 [Acer saccharum]|uniref:non-specific serine/threonine protein kinase n=1 Tax=Acer saccharum TaxID=4024 RepID=A0AA39S3W7_ACESA|nr:hypothetical protein LWI29_002213 [Acer saccharum]